MNVVVLVTDGGDVVDFPHDIGAMGHANETRLVAQQRRQIVCIQMARFGINGPLPPLDASGGQPPPSAGIRLVVLIGHNDRIARTNDVAFYGLCAPDSITNFDLTCTGGKIASCFTSLPD